MSGSSDAMDRSSTSKKKNGGCQTIERAVEYIGPVPAILRYYKTTVNQLVERMDHHTGARSEAPMRKRVFDNRSY